MGAAGEGPGDSGPDSRCPVLFLLQTDDELVPRQAASPCSAPSARPTAACTPIPGATARCRVEEMEASEAFFARHLVTPLGS